MSDETKELQQWQKAIERAKPKFKDIIKNSTRLQYETELNFAVQALQNNDFLMSVANNNPLSLQNAIVNIAAIGLSLNPAEKLAYLVPRRSGQKDQYSNKMMAVCLDISYIGLIRLATDTGSIQWARAELIYENDDFVYHGAFEKPEFSTPKPFDRGSLQGVYCVAKTKEGDYLSGIMSLDEAYDIRNRSEAFKKESGPWVTDEGEMIKKTIIKRESKTWPKSDKTDRFDNAIEIINEHEGIDFSNQIAPDPIDHQKVEEAYVKAIEIIDSDDLEYGGNASRELFNTLTQDEQMKLFNKLRNFKPGKRQYNTVFKELLDYLPPEPVLPDHVLNG